MKISAFFLLLLQIALIGLAAFVLSGGFGPPKPISVAIQISATLVNLIGGAFSLRILLR